MDNVYFVLDNNFLKQVKDNRRENSWEILNVGNMNTFVFPNDSKSTGTNAVAENGAKCWCPSNIDIACVFETIGYANMDKSGKSTKPSFVKEKYWATAGMYTGGAGDGGDNKTKLIEGVQAGLMNRPCGFLTPRQSIMPMIIIPSDKFVQNGLTINYNMTNKNPYFSVDEKKYKNAFNWWINTNRKDNLSKKKINVFEKNLPQDTLNILKNSVNFDGLNKVDGTGATTLKYYGKKVFDEEGFGCMYGKSKY